MKLIVGVDPGMITAIAAVDMDSDFCHTFSRRNFSFTEVCDHLVNVGEPVVVATDTMRLPDAVKKISAAFNARTFLPRRDLMIGEKKAIVGKAANDHERDALASALYAKDFFSPLFKKIENALEKRGVSHLSPEVKEILIKREAGNIEQAVKMLSAVEHKEVRIVPRVIETRKIIRLKERMKSLEEEKNRLEKKVYELEKENTEIAKNLEISSRKNESRIISNLRKSISSVLEEKNNIEEEYGLFRQLSADYEIIAEPGENAKGRVIILHDPGAERIEAMQPKAVITEEFVDTFIPLIHPKRVELRRAGRFTVISKKQLDEALQSSETFLEWLGRYKSRYHETKT